jgi:hypothetical protein
MAGKWLHELLGFSPGNIVVKAIKVSTWGDELAFDCIYHYPPNEQAFTVRFYEVHSIEWYIQRDSSEIRKLENAQLLTHDLGAANHQSPARFSTTLAELILSYGRIEISKS